MKILFDLIPIQPFGNTRYHGSAEYAFALFEHILKIKKTEKISAVIDRKRPIDPEILKIAHQKCDHVFFISRISEVVDIISKNGFITFYTAVPLKYRNLNFKDVNFIFTIHDLRPIELPSDQNEKKYSTGISHHIYDLGKRLFVQYNINRQRDKFLKLFSVSPRYRIIVVSRHTQYSLYNEFPEINKNSIEMLYSPSVSKAAEDKKFIAKLKIEKNDFYLLISANRWKKNIYRAIQAFKEIYHDYPDFNKKVIVVGRTSDIKFLSELENDNRFILLDYISRPQLESLFRYSFCFIFPSLNEGFGYPPLECMKYGTPVIASAIASLPEILENGVVYVNPYSISEMKNRIVQIYDDEKLRDRLKLRGIKRYREVLSSQNQALNRLSNLVLGRIC